MSIYWRILYISKHYTLSVDMSREPVENILSNRHMTTSYRQHKHILTKCRNI